MSRIGKRPVELPSGVSASVSGQTVEVKGPKGAQTFTATDDVTIAVEENAVSVTPRGNSKRARQQWGMSRTIVANMVHGVQNTFKKELEIQGVGYRAQVQGQVLKLNLGYSHDVDFAIPDGIDFDEYETLAREWLRTKGEAHHHESPAGRDLSDCEKAALSGAMAKLKAVG